jgi:hypothetical protein
VLALLDGLEEQRSLSLMEKNFRKQLRAHLLILLESKLSILEVEIHYKVG